MTLPTSQRSRIAPKRQGGKQMAVVLLLSLLAAGSLRAEGLLDASAVPGLTEAGRALYDEWLLTNTPRVAAVGSNGRIGWYGGGGSLAAARARAVALCTEHGGTDCRPYAENLDIVWPGREQRSAPPPEPFVSTINYAFVPDERFLWHGPAAASGVVVWSHGNRGPDIDSRGIQPPPMVRYFNNAGFDVVRFDRAPMVDTATRAAGWLRDGLTELRRAGYRRVVAAGQSRGGWTSLQMRDTAGLVDAVIALSPAAHGSGGSINLMAQDDDLRALVADAQSPQTRVAVVQFADDPFMSDADTRVRLLERLRPHVAGLLVIDRPVGLKGHFGGLGGAFSREFGSCLLGFVIGAVPTAACPGAHVDP